jgi:hypothetical protein
MKTKPYFIIIVIAAGIVSGCNRNDQPPAADQNLKQQVNATEDASAKAKDEFLASMDKDMVALDAKIDKLANKSANATGDAKVRADQALADLQSQRDAVRKQYDKLKLSVQDAWDTTKAGFQSAWDGLVKAYDDTAAKLSSN